MKLTLRPRISSHAPNIAVAILRGRGIHPFESAAFRGPDTPPIPDIAAVVQSAEVLSGRLRDHRLVYGSGVSAVGPHGAGEHRDGVPARGHRRRAVARTRPRGAVRHRQ